MVSAPHSLALGYALAGFTVWVLSDVCMKLAGDAAMPPEEVVGFLGLFGAPIMGIIFWTRGRMQHLVPTRPVAQIGRALLTVGSTLANAVALKHLPLTLFYTTVFTAPLAVALLASLLLGERLSLVRLLGILGGFGGVVIAIDPFTSQAGGDVIGYGAALFSVLCFAASTVWLRTLTRTETPDSLVFSACLLQAALGLVVIAGGADLPAGPLLLVLAGMAACSLIGNIFIFRALRSLAAALVMQFHYTQLITGTVLGYLIWRDVPAWHTVLGAAIIIAAGLSVAAGDRGAVSVTSPVNK